MFSILTLAKLVLTRIVSHCGESLSFRIKLEQSGDQLSLFVDWKWGRLNHTSSALQSICTVGLFSPYTNRNVETTIYAFYEDLHVRTVYRGTTARQSDFMEAGHHWDQDSVTSTESPAKKTCSFRIYNELQLLNTECFDHQKFIFNYF